MDVLTISPLELAAKQKRGEPVELIDVRTPIEYREVHCPFARNLPISELDPQAFLNGRNGSSEAPLYVICRSGSRGKHACEKFLAVGFRNVVNVEGGTVAWTESGLPVVRGKAMVSLERQVRMTAGSLVLLGAILGLFVHQYFLGLSAFIGAGLVFSGLTDTCGMGLALAKMPWNRITPAACTNPTALRG